MAKERSELSPYKSLYGAGWISERQYLAEGMCARKARAGGNELTPRFWNETYWKKEFLLQLRHAANLLQNYDIGSIIKALRHPDAKRIYSLGLKSVLVPLIDKIQQDLETQSEIQTRLVIESVDVNQRPRPPFSRGKSILQRLREIENG